MLPDNVLKFIVYKFRSGWIKENQIYVDFEYKDIHQFRILFYTSWDFIELVDYGFNVNARIPISCLKKEDIYTTFFEFYRLVREKPFYYWVDDIGKDPNTCVWDITYLAFGGSIKVKAKIPGEYIMEYRSNKGEVITRNGYASEPDILFKMMDTFYNEIVNRPKYTRPTGRPLRWNPITKRFE